MNGPKKLSVVGVIVLTTLIVSHDSPVHSAPITASANPVDPGVVMVPSLARPCDKVDFKPDRKFVVLSDKPETVAAANILRYRVASDYEVQLGVWVTDGRILKKGSPIRIMEVRCPDSNVTELFDGLLVVE